MQVKGFDNSDTTVASDRNVCKKSYELGKSWHQNSIYMDVRPCSSSIFVIMSIFFIQSCVACRRRHRLINALTKL
ncbi:hypothetical protein [Nostoc sp.]|uniref:hypothetical protein n=1 Tax=Nostoc sp. TaxID=1180 RepID=UPI002FEEADB9